jgi:cytoplasmic iron level regulating protein YaaA (DUF328/UPF0246 family)
LKRNLPTSKYTEPAFLKESREIKSVETKVPKDLSELMNFSKVLGYKLAT